MPDRFTFLPYATTGLQQLATTPADASVPHLELQLNAEITADGMAQPNPIALSQGLRGPGDIISVSRNVVRRVEPEAGLRGFEPDYLPFVEFHDADFPWRYSLDANTNGNRRDPWLALIVLQADEFELREAGNAPLPSLTVKDASASLPDLAQSWAHAHVQVDLPTTGSQDVAAALAADGNPAFSRLFATRRLAPSKAYFMFLVPSWLAGVDAGLGRKVEAGLTDRAWDAGVAAPVTLPIYLQWRFTTDAGENVELLLRRLRAFRADDPTEAGAAKKASAADPGYYAGYSNPGAEFTLQAAMVQPSQPEEPYNTDPALANRMVATLTEAIAGEEVDDTSGDPLVTFPAHGFRYRPDTTATVARAQANEWFDRINLDLKFRHAAGLGAQVARKHQEVFSHLCWLQYREVTEANEKLARLQTAKRLAESIAQRRLGKLDSAVTLTLAEPLQDVARVNAKFSVQTTLERTGAPTSYAGRSLRRQASKRARTTSEAGTGAIPAPAIPGDRQDTALPTVNDRGPQPGPLADRGLVASAAQLLTGLFPQAAFAETARPGTTAVRVAKFDSADLAAPILGLLQKLPVAKAQFTIGGLTVAEAQDPKPVWRAPHIPLPTAGFLEEISTDAMLADADRMPENTVSLFLENRKFVESLLVGLNHEMNNELRWREFPTDLRGTVFRRFWDRHLPPDNPAGDDIADIHTWRKKLGNHFPPADSDNKANVIAVIRGDIVRKLKDPIVVINIAPTTKWEYGKGEDHEPVFSGTIGRDIAYFGFDIARTTLLSAQVKPKAFFVIYERPGRLRFGMDVATANVRQLRADLSLTRYAIPTETLRRPFLQARPTKALSAPQAPPATPATPDDLSWSHARLAASDHIDFSHNIAFGQAPQYWDNGKTSASLARAMWQKPVAGVLPLGRVL